MAWSTILGHEALAERFRESVALGRLAHAYLFIGREGIGKELFARELAKALLCGQGAGEACDACRSCQKVEHGNHPDVSFIRRIARTAKGERRTQILIDQVREEIQEPIGYKPYEGSHKVFVVADAERMTEEAQNGLLKTLEEPPPHSLLILLASRAEPFVDTVVSRCRIVRFRALAADVAERILVERLECEPEAARVLARLSGGSPGLALRYRDGEGYETVLWLLAELAAMAPGGEFVLAGEILDHVKKTGDRLEDTRERLRAVLALLTLAWRDLLLAALGCREELQTWRAPCEGLRDMGARLTPERAKGLVELGIETRERLDRNANIKLLLEKMLLDTCALVHGREPIAVR